MGGLPALQIRREGGDVGLDVFIRTPPGRDAGDIGMSVRSLTPSERSELKVDSGVRVTEVADDSEAQNKDIQVNDVIEEVNRVPVSNADEFRAQVAKAPVKSAINPTLTVCAASDAGRLAPAATASSTNLRNTRASRLITHRSYHALPAGSGNTSR